MRLLLVESVPGEAHEIRDSLVAEGHEVVSCTDDHGGPCRGVHAHAACPLAEHVDLAVVVYQDGRDHTLHEMGATCARRHRVPTTEVDPASLDDMPNVTVAKALAGRKVDAGYAIAIRKALDDLPVLVHVDRQVSCVHVALQLPESLATPTKVSYLSDRARAAVRNHDPHCTIINISVTTYPD